MNEIKEADIGSALHLQGFLRKFSSKSFNMWWALYST